MVQRLNLGRNMVTETACAIRIMETSQYELLVGGFWCSLNIPSLSFRTSRHID